MIKPFHFRFTQKGKLVKKIECSFTEARRTGNELADELGSVDMHCYNEHKRKWEFMGTYHGNMRVTGIFGDKLVIKPDFSGIVEEVIKNEEDLLDKIKEAVANYCYDNKDLNFRATISISAQRGWAFAKIIDKEAKR